MEVERRGALLVAEAGDQLDALAEVIVDAREHLEEARVDRLLGAGALAAPEVVELVERVVVEGAVLVVEVDRERFAEVDRVELDLARRLVERLVAKLVGGREAAGEGRPCGALLRFLPLAAGAAAVRLGDASCSSAQARSRATPCQRRRNAANQIDFRNGLVPPEIATLPSLMPPVGSARIVWAREPPITYIPSGPLGLRSDSQTHFFDRSESEIEPSREFYFYFVRRPALSDAVVERQVVQLDVELLGDIEDAAVAIELAEDDAADAGVGDCLKQFQHGEAVT